MCACNILLYGYARAHTHCTRRLCTKLCACMGQVPHHVCSMLSQGFKRCTFKDQLPAGTPIGISIVTHYIGSHICIHMHTYAATCKGLCAGVAPAALSLLCRLLLGHEVKLCILDSLLLGVDLDVCLIQLRQVLSFLDFLQHSAAQRRECVWRWACGPEV